MTEILFIIYLLFSLGVCFAGTFFTLIETEDETNIIARSFYLQSLLYARMEDDVSPTGIAIVLIASTVFLLPCNLLVLLVQLIVILCETTWKLFKWIFKKK